MVIVFSCSRKFLSAILTAKFDQSVQTAQCCHKKNVTLTQIIVTQFVVLAGANGKFWRPVVAELAKSFVVLAKVCATSATLRLILKIET